MNEGVNDRRHGPASKKSVIQHVFMHVAHIYIYTNTSVCTGIHAWDLGGSAEGKLCGSRTAETQLLMPGEAPNPTRPHPCQ